MNQLVSVLTPSFNHATWLGDNLRSVSNQTYPHIEHVVMDGGSNDGTIELLKQAGENVTWRSEADRGQSHALNKAFEASRGDIIGWLNSDDAYVDKRSVESAVRIFERHPEIGLVYGHGLMVNSSNRVLQYLWTPSFDRSAFRRGTFFVQPSVFLRRSVLSQPFVDESLQYVMDRDLWLRLLDRTEFMRMDLVVGLDRQQASRKSLTSDLVEEHEVLERAYGHERSARQRAILKAQKVAIRLRGVPMAIQGERRIDLALELDFGLPLERAWYQSAVPRSRMPL